MTLNFFCRIWSTRCPILKSYSEMGNGKIALHALYLVSTKGLLHTRSMLPIDTVGQKLVNGLRS